VREEAIASSKAEECQGIKDSAEKDLAEALPALDEAVQCLRDLKLNDISEVAKYAALKPAFDKRWGTITAGNASPLTDGASAVVLLSPTLSPALAAAPRAELAEVGRGGRVVYSGTSCAMPGMPANAIWVRPMSTRSAWALSASPLCFRYVSAALGATWYAAREGAGVPSERAELGRGRLSVAEVLPSVKVLPSSAEEADTLIVCRCVPLAGSETADPGRVPIGTPAVSAPVGACA
jgi:hypothetical protein